MWGEILNIKYSLTYLAIIYLQSLSFCLIIVVTSTWALYYLPEKLYITLTWKTIYFYYLLKFLNFKIQNHIVRAHLRIRNDAYVKCKTSRLIVSENSYGKYKCRMFSLHYIHLKISFLKLFFWGNDIQIENIS